jgi:hypothetical protein
MASTYEKVLLYKVVKTWEDNNPNLSKVYKLQSNNTCNKSQVEIYKDNGKYGIEFTIDKTIPEFNKGAEKCDLNNWFDPFTRLTIDGQVESKEQKERDVSFIFGQRSLILQTPSIWDSIPWMQTSK